MRHRRAISSSPRFVPSPFVLFPPLFCFIVLSMPCFPGCNPASTVLAFSALSSSRSAFSVSTLPSSSLTQHTKGTKNDKKESKHITVESSNDGKTSKLLVDNARTLSVGEIKPIEVVLPLNTFDSNDNDAGADAHANSGNHGVLKKNIEMGLTTRIGKYAFRQGLPEALTTELQQFIRGGKDKRTRTNGSKETSIDEIFRVLCTVQPLEPGESLKVQTSCNKNDNSDKQQQQEWNIQRPRSHWSNNMHWIAPANKIAEEAYRDLLQNAGFNDVLKGIAEEMKLDINDLAIHHLFFIGVNHASNSYTHVDFDDTNGRGFTVLFPLRLPNADQPELGFQQRNTNNDIDENTGWYGWYKYRMNEAALVGDGTWHVTADCDYRDQGDYRVCANIYVCDKSHPINDATNVKGVYINNDDSK